MQFLATLLPAMGLLAAVNADAWNATSYTTITTDVYTTFCPKATTFTQGTKTYTATASETITITDCPCTISKPVQPTWTPKPLPPKNETTVIVTTTVSEYTTYCPYPTTIIQGNQTYTATSSETLTITNCPCTLTKPGVVSVTTSYLTTYCPAPTTITIGTSTYPVSVPGTITIPVVSKTTSIVQTPAGSGGNPGGPNATPNVPVGPTTSPAATTTGPIQANSGNKIELGFGSLAAAGLVALLL